MRGLIVTSTGAAYPPVDLQADPVTRSPRVASESRVSILRTFRPYRFGMSRPDLRPAVPEK